MDATHVVFLSFSAGFFVLSVVNTVLSVFNLTYPLNNPILLFVALYAILFSFVNSSYFSSKFKFAGLFSLPFLVSLLVFLAIHYHVDLNGLNNGLSLIALSISIFLLPFRTFEEAVEREMNDRNIREIAYLKNEIDRINISHKEHTDVLMNEWKDAVEHVRNITDEYVELTSKYLRLERELDESKSDIKMIGTQHEYEKTDMVEEFELNMYQNQQEIEKLEREIEELKKQK